MTYLMASVESRGVRGEEAALAAHFVGILWVNSVFHA